MTCKVGAKLISWKRRSGKIEISFFVVVTNLKSRDAHYIDGVCVDSHRYFWFMLKAAVYLVHKRVPRGKHNFESHLSRVLLWDEMNQRISAATLISTSRNANANVTINTNANPKRHTLNTKH